MPTVEALEAVEEIAPFLLRDTDVEAEKEVAKVITKELTKEAVVNVPSDKRDDSTNDNNDGNGVSISDDVEVGDVKGDWQTYEATAYTARCDGCTGITKTGVDVRNTIYHGGKRVIAVDPSRIPLGSSVEVRLSDGSTFEATAQDIGSAIKGARIDVLHGDKDSMRHFGRQAVEVRLIR